MIIQDPTPRTKKVDDYDFLFDSGFLLPLTVDPSLGDTIEFSDVGVKINLVGKPSTTDPDQFTPPEDHTIFTRHLCAVTHRVREAPVVTKEQKTEWVRTIQEISKSVH
jgi:hypothetical protein